MDRKLSWTPAIGMVLMFAASMGALAQQTLKDNSCRMELVNRSCDLKVEGGNSPALPAVKAELVEGHSGNNNQKNPVVVTVVVPHQPTEKVTFDAATTLQAQPDFGALALQKLMDSLKVVEFKTQQFPISPVVVPNVSANEAHIVAPPSCPPDLVTMSMVLADVGKEQDSISGKLTTWGTGIPTFKKQLAELRAMKKWKNDQGLDLQDAIRNGFRARLAELTGTNDSAGCGESGSGLASCELPAGKVSELRRELTDTMVLYAATGNVNAACRGKIGADLVTAVRQQAQLEAAFAEATEVHGSLVQVLQKMKDVNVDEDLTPERREPLNAPGLTAQTKVKITKTDIWTGKATPLADQTVLWQSLRWELSAGVAFSNLGKRTFGVAPDLDSAGKPVKENDKAVTRITRNTTQPAVMPLVLVSGRLGYESLHMNRRFAVLGSVGLGTNSGTAEGFSGLSVATGDLLISFGVHLGRSNKLDGPLKVGDKTELSKDDLGNFQDKHWTARPSLALTYRVPLS